VTIPVTIPITVSIPIPRIAVTVAGISIPIPRRVGLVGPFIADDDTPLQQRCDTESNKRQTLECMHLRLIAHLFALQREDRFERRAPERLAPIAISMGSPVIARILFEPQLAPALARDHAKRGVA